MSSTNGESLSKMEVTGNSTLETYSGPITYQCDDNGTLLAPIQVGPSNQTLTTADQVS